MKPEVVYLEVPYQEKDQAKGLGARWDAEEKKWYVPSGKQVLDFEKWIPDEESD